MYTFYFPLIALLVLSIMIVGYLSFKFPSLLHRKASGVFFTLGFIVAALLLNAITQNFKDFFPYLLAILQGSQFIFMQTIKGLRNRPKLFFLIYSSSLIIAPIAFFAFFVILFSGQLLWPYVIASMIFVACWFLAYWLGLLEQTSWLKLLLPLCLILGYSGIYIVKHNPYVYGHTVYTKYRVNGHKVHFSGQISQVMHAYQQLLVYQLDYDYQDIKSVEILYIRRYPEQPFTNNGKFTGLALVNGEHYVDFDFTLPMDQEGRERNDYEEGGDSVNVLSMVLKDSNRPEKTFTLNDISNPAVTNSLKDIKITYYDKSDTFRIYDKKRDQPKNSD